MLTASTFSGGLEMLFSDQRQHKLSIPAHHVDGKPVTIANLIDYLCENVMRDRRKELFVLDGHMQVLVLSPTQTVPGIQNLQPQKLWSKYDTRTHVKRRSWSTTRY